MRSVMFGEVICPMVLGSVVREGVASGKGRRFLLIMAAVFMMRVVNGRGADHLLWVPLLLVWFAQIRLLLQPPVWLLQLLLQLLQLYLSFARIRLSTVTP
jgi:hypothetical protein